MVVTAVLAVLVSQCSANESNQRLLNLLTPPSARSQAYLCYEVVETIKEHDDRPIVTKSRVAFDTQRKHILMDVEFPAMDSVPGSRLLMAINPDYRFEIQRVRNSWQLKNYCLTSQSPASAGGFVLNVDFELSDLFLIPGTFSGMDGPVSFISGIQSGTINVDAIETSDDKVKVQYKRKAGGNSVSGVVTLAKSCNFHATEVQESTANKSYIAKCNYKVADGFIDQFESTEEYPQSKSGHLGQQRVKRLYDLAATDFFLTAYDLPEPVELKKSMAYLLWVPLTIIGVIFIYFGVSQRSARNRK